MACEVDVYLQAELKLCIYKPESRALPVLIVVAEYERESSVNENFAMGNYV